MTAPKMTVVTYPDFHLDPGSERILLLGPGKITELGQDTIGACWPNRDVTVYLGDPSIPNVRDAIEQQNWIYYHSRLATTIIMMMQSWDWVWPMVVSAQCEKFFIDDIPLPASTLLRNSLNLTYPGRVFHNISEAVQAAALVRL